MCRKIDVYINGLYEFSSNQYSSCKAMRDHIRSTKHIEVASVPENRRITVNDNDSLRVVYAK